MKIDSGAQSVHINSIAAKTLNNIAAVASEALSAQKAPSFMLGRILATTLSTHSILAFVTERMKCTNSVAIDAANESLHKVALSSIAGLNAQMVESGTLAHLLNAITALVPDIDPSVIAHFSECFFSGEHDTSDLCSILFSVVDDFMASHFDNQINPIYDETNPDSDATTFADCIQMGVDALAEAVNCCLSRSRLDCAYSVLDYKLRLFA